MNITENFKRGRAQECGKQLLEAQANETTITAKNAKTSLSTGIDMEANQFYQTTIPQILRTAYEADKLSAKASSDRLHGMTPKASV